VHRARPRQKLKYDAALVERFRHLPENRCIRQAGKSRTCPEL
jgi:hypothetical protein